MIENRKRKPLDMLHGSIWNKLPLFALPVAATAILEQLFNASDIAVVGNFTGAGKTIAVAAVGANSSIISLIVNLFVGIALGANVVIANAIGRKDKDAVTKAVHTSIIIAILAGIGVAITGELVANPLLVSLQVPKDVFPEALLYLRIYLLGMPVILLYNFEAAIFRSTGDTKTPLVILTISGILNVLLNLFFVAVLHMTVNGVAIATVVSNAVSSILLFYCLVKDYYGAWRALEELYEEGKVKSIGVDNFTQDRMADFLFFNKIKPAVNMIECNAYFQREDESEYLKAQNILMQAWSPLAAGKENLFTNKILCSIAQKHGKSVAQIVLRWLVQRGIVPVVKSVNPVRMKENLDIFDFVLSEEEMKQIATLDTGHSYAASRNTGKAVAEFLEKANTYYV